MSSAAYSRVNCGHTPDERMHTSLDRVMTFQKLFLQGLALHKVGKFAAAEEIYGQILLSHPDHCAVKFLNTIASKTRRIKLEMHLAEKLGDAKPSYASLHDKLKADLQNLRRVEEALEIIEEALHLEKQHVRRLSDCDGAPWNIECFAENDNIYETCFMLSQFYAAAFFEIGHALFCLKSYAEAASCFDKAIYLKPNYTQAFVERAHALGKLQKFDQALASLDGALALEPNNAVALANRGVVLAKLNRLCEALVCYDKALELQADLADALYNRSFALLMSGQLDRGWREYETRKLRGEWCKVPSYSKPLWTGDEDIQGKSILIHWEQGLGDTIQFCRYINELEKRGAQVLFSPQKVLQKLMERLSETAKIVDGHDIALVFDYHCPLMSLPLAFGTNLENMPAEVPYLSAQPDRIRKWREKIGDHGFKIGICWQGSTRKIDVGRSFSLAEFFTLSQIEGCRLISLHRGEGEDQLARLPDGMKVETLGPEFDAGPDAFLDTAAVMKCCDLVITSDTAIAHLSGALGLPTWVALKYTPDWRWFLNRSDSPWYPTMRLFRQTTPGDWPGVFQEIRRALVELKSRQ